MSEQSNASSKIRSRIARVTLAAALMTGASVSAAQAAHKVGWVWANDPEAESYTPNPGYSFNSSGGAITINRNSIGVYQVNFAGLGSSLKTNVLVSGYNTNGTCKVLNWTPSSGSAVVECFNAAGSPADSQFTLLYQAHGGEFGSPSKGIAFLWANDPTSASYTPPTNYQYNSFGATNTVARTGTGSYVATLPGLTQVGGTVQVTAYGSGAGRCKTSGWAQDAGGSFIYVNCFDASGAASDQQFTLAYARAEPLAYLGQEVLGLYGWFNKSKGQNYKLSKVYRFNNLVGDALIGDRTAKGETTVTTLSSPPNLVTSNMLVTAYGDDSSYCNVVEWFPLQTACYGQGGHPKDSKYNVAFHAVPEPF